MLSPFCFNEQVHGPETAFVKSDAAQKEQKLRGAVHTLFDPVLQGDAPFHFRFKCRAAHVAHAAHQHEVQDEEDQEMDLLLPDGGDPQDQVDEEEADDQADERERHRLRDHHVL